MATSALVLDPPLPDLPSWGAPQPLWWLLLAVGLLLWLQWRRRTLAEQRANAAWQALIDAFLVASRDGQSSEAQALAYQLKGTLLCYWPRSEVAGLRADQSLALLCQYCGVEHFQHSQAWLASVCYRGEIIAVSTAVAGELTTIAAAMQTAGRPRGD